MDKKGKKIKKKEGEEKGPGVCAVYFISFLLPERYREAKEKKREWIKKKETEKERPCVPTRCLCQRLVRHAFHPGGKGRGGD